MKLTCYVVSLVALPLPAAASGGDGFSFAASLAQMLGALAVVLGLVYLLSHVSKRWLKGGMGRQGRQNYIRIVETRHLSPKKSLLLVEVGGEYLLLSNGSEGTTLIKQIDMLEEIEVVEVLSPHRGTSLPDRFQERLDGFMNRVQGPPLLSSGMRSAR